MKLENKSNVFKKDLIPTKTVFVEQKSQIDRSMLYSFEGSFQILHVDVGNVEFLGRSAIDP